MDQFLAILHLFQHGRDQLSAETGSIITIQAGDWNLPAKMGEFQGWPSSGLKV